MSRWDPKQHPRWAANAPGGQGGEFRDSWVQGVLGRMGFDNDQQASRALIRAFHGGSTVALRMLNRDQARQLRGVATQLEATSENGSGDWNAGYWGGKALDRRVAMLTPPGEEGADDLTQRMVLEQADKLRGDAAGLVADPKRMRRWQDWTLGERHEHYRIVQMVDGPDSSVAQAADLIATEYERRSHIAPWLRGGASVDVTYEHYDEFVRLVGEQIKERGFSPSRIAAAGHSFWGRDAYPQETTIMRTMTDDKHGPVDVQGRRVSSIDWWVENKMTKIFMLSEAERLPLRSADQVFDSAMAAAGEQGGKEISIHILAEYPDFASSGDYEIWDDKLDRWDLLEDLDWNEDDELLTVWAGDRHFVMTIDDYSPTLRRVP